MLNTALQDKLTSIEQYNSFLVSLPYSGYEKIADILTEILQEEHAHIGKLQVALEMVDPKAKLRVQGEAQALLNANKENITIMT